MTSAVDAVLSLAESLGAASVAGLWAPVAAWSVLAAIVLAVVARWGSRSPALAYRAVQAVLLALPVGVALALVVDPSWLPAWRVVSAPVVGPGPALALSAPSPTPVASAPPVSWGLALAGGLTLAAGVVAVVGVARLGAQLVRTRRLRRALPVAEAGGLSGDVEAVRARTGLRRAPRVIATPADVVPMTLGVLRPLVVVPASLGQADRRLALAHEFVHVRQRDPLGHAAEAVTAAAFGVHPLAHALARRCDLYREMACDAAVLADSAADRRSYAALVSAFATRPHALAAPALGMAARPHVHHRLLAMTHPRTPSRFAAPLALALLTATVVTVLAGSAVAQPARVTVTESDEAVVIDEAVIIDGKRVEGRFADLGLDTDDIYAIEVLRGETARAAHGTDRVISITTLAAAEARGLASNPGSAAGESPRVEVSFNIGDFDEARGEAVRMIVRNEDGTEAAVSELPGGLRAGDVLTAMTEDDRPLIVIDGEVADQEALNALDPSDIATVDVRRGEAAVAAYGPAAANGVVGVVTKAAAEAEVGPSAEASVEAEPAAEGFSVGPARPNPATDEVALPLLLASGQDVRVEVFDLAGRLVLEQTQAMPAGASSVALDVSSLAAGAYVVRAAGTVDGRPALAQSRFTIAR